MCHLPRRNLAGGDPATAEKWQPAYSCFFDTANEFGSVPAANLATRAGSAHMCVLTWKKKRLLLSSSHMQKPIILDCEVIEEKDS